MSPLVYVNKNKFDIFNLIYLSFMIINRTKEINSEHSAFIHVYIFKLNLLNNYLYLPDLLYSLF